MGYTREELSGIPAESIMGLGCSNPLKYARIRKGDTVLDLGCGVGMDVFLAAARVGDGGRAIGIDMTAEMIGKARLIAAHHNYANVDFKVAEMENLPFPDGSVDLVISNQSVSLSSDQPLVWKEAFRILRPGGRAVIADTVSMGTSHERMFWSESPFSVIQLARDRYIGQISEAGFTDIAIVAEHYFEPVESGYENITGVIAITIETLKPMIEEVG